MFGLSGEFKNIKPSLTSTTGSLEDGNLTKWKNDETLSSWAVVASYKLNLKPITFKTQATYGTNLTDVLMTSSVVTAIDSAACP